VLLSIYHFNYYIIFVTLQPLTSHIFKKNNNRLPRCLVDGRKG